VTFIIAVAFLDTRQVAYGGHMVAAMALMESPAIIVAIVLARKYGGISASQELPATAPNASKPAKSVAPDGNPTIDQAPQIERKHTSWTGMLHEAVFNSAVLLLMGSMAIGLIIGKAGFTDLTAFADAPFKGVLCLFMLEMGLLAAKRLSDLRKAGPAAIAFGLVSPPIHASLGIVVAYVLGLGTGDALLLAVLAGSASYIAVPAALRLSLPAANASVYVPMSLGLTFPFNVVIGIPLYWAIIGVLWGG
ncbi:MAG: sodium-dependent bicarbonate transport family permease, partial [Planctomycetota bacterium]